MDRWMVRLSRPASMSPSSTTHRSAPLWGWGEYWGIRRRVNDPVEPHGLIVVASYVGG